MARISSRRPSCINMCSVRHRPMPSAPNSRAFFASPGVSALARTFKSRSSSAHARICSKSSESSASMSGTSPSTTLPLLPSMVIVSPALKVLPSTLTSPASRSISIALQPVTAGLPKPRATTAAWLVMPPRAVRMPLALDHAVHVVRVGRFAHQDDRLSRLALLLGLVGGKNDPARGRPRRSR